MAFGGTTGGGFIGHQVTLHSDSKSVKYTKCIEVALFTLQACSFTPSTNPLFNMQQVVLALSFTFLCQLGTPFLGELVATKSYCTYVHACTGLPAIVC